MVTFDEARRWLGEIGGVWDDARESQPLRTRRSIVVSVMTGSGEMVARQALYDDTAEDWEREMEFRRAFVRACDELKRALEQDQTRPGDLR